MDDVIIRPARKADVNVVVELIYSSGPRAFDFVFSGNKKSTSLDFLRYMFVREDVLFSYQQHFVAELDGKVVGIIGAFTKKSMAGTMLATALQIFRFFGARGGLKNLFRGLKFEAKLVKPPLKGCFYLCHVGVSGEYQGQGIGEKMVKLMEKRALGMRLKKLSLDVSVINPRAQQLYERLSFSVIREHSSYTDKLDNHRYMEFLLD